MRTQLFFNPDGTISHGATDGPPPAGVCGLWQCGAGQFQMTLSRAFSSPSSMLDSSLMRGQMTDDITYAVVRIYQVCTILLPTPYFLLTYSVVRVYQGTVTKQDSGAPALQSSQPP